MTAHPEAAYTMAVDWPARERDLHPDTLAWEARIESMRDEDAGPVCSTCGCTTRHVEQTRRCIDCKLTKILTAFPRNRGQRFGRHHACRPCKSRRDAVIKRELKRRQFRAVLGVAS